MFKDESISSVVCLKTLNNQGESKGKEGLVGGSLLVFWKARGSVTDNFIS